MEVFRLSCSPDRENSKHKCSTLNWAHASAEKVVIVAEAHDQRGCQGVHCDEALVLHREAREAVEEKHKGHLPGGILLIILDTISTVVATIAISI